MAENFDLIFGQNASQQYAWNDADYQNGWETIGNIPPTAAQFDALQRRSDTKLKELNDELTPLVNADTADSRQPSTTYSEGDIKYSPLLPTGWFLACTVSGMSSASELVVPSPVEEDDEITDGGVTWKIKKIAATATTSLDIAVQIETHDADKNAHTAAITAQRYIIASAPAYIQREQLATPNRTTITLHPMWVNIGGNGYIIDGDKTIDLTQGASYDDATLATAANRKGKDLYAYACQPQSGHEPLIIISANSTVPTGYTATSSRKIGGFHGLCADVGTISGHWLTGYVAGDILPASVWDLRHRPKSEPEGMVYVDGIGKWADIYLAGVSGNTLVSRYGAEIADEASSVLYHGEKFAEVLGTIGKSLMWRDEFMCAADGSNQGTNIANSADPNTAGGHVDTAGRRMISNYGLEDCCGALWQWGRDCYEGGSYGTYAGTYQWFDGYSWNNTSVYNNSSNASWGFMPVDTGGAKGSCNGFLRRSLLGSYWVAGSYCGSRALAAYAFSACAHASCGGRGASEPAVE